MSGLGTPGRKCSRCGTAIDSCAFCDQPDCPAITCYRCMAVAFLDRLRPKLGQQVASQQHP
jgi:hypothetical protein